VRGEGERDGRARAHHRQVLAANYTTMSLDQKDIRRIDRTAKRHAEKVAENLKRLEEELDAEGVRTIRRIDVLEDMLEISRRCGDLLQPSLC